MDILLRPLAALLPLHDYSTDLADPPRLSANPSAAPRGAALMRALAPLAPAELPLPPAAAFAAALAVARRTPGWEVTVEDAGRGCIEGVATTRLMRFKDDFAIRVRPSPAAAGGGGSRVDMRSCSRVGVGDMGANAARIRRFLSALRAEAAPRE